MHASQESNVTPITVAEMTMQQKRKRWLMILAIVVALGAVTGFGYWSLVASKHVSTDNAYAAADAAQISSQTSGTVKTVMVVDTQNVKAGDVLVTLDDTDANIALQQAEANAARAQTELDRAEANLTRRKKLALSGFVSAEELGNFENAYKVAKANADLANAGLAEARLTLNRTIIRAPIDGVIAKREVELGQRISPGMHLLSIIPVAQMYVNANFKEVQLAKVKVGQPVEVHADIYGSKVKYRGKVAGVSGGTGSAFAIIPAQNATGNWIKVVQRLPVRIELEKEDVAKYPLRVGLSMHVDINIGGHGE